MRWASGRFFPFPERQLPNTKRQGMCTVGYALAGLTAPEEVEPGVVDPQASRTDSRGPLHCRTQMWWISSAVRMLPRMIRLHAYIKTIESNLVGSKCVCRCCVQRSTLFHLIPVCCSRHGFFRSREHDHFQWTGDCCSTAPNLQVCRNYLPICTLGTLTLHLDLTFSS
jgi:hypothetical protein